MNVLEERPTTEADVAAYEVDQLRRECDLWRRKYHDLLDDYMQTKSENMILKTMVKRND